MARKRKRKSGDAVQLAPPPSPAPSTTTSGTLIAVERTSPPTLRIVEPIADDPVPPKSIAPIPPAFDRAMAEYGAGRMLEALALFDEAVIADPDNHRARSYWGLLLVVERGQQKRGLEHAETAAAQAPDDVDVWLNLARIFVKLEQKGRAIDVLREGMKRHTDHDALATMLATLGVRRAPPIKSLPRSHPLNKWVGIALYRWLKVGRSA